MKISILLLFVSVGMLYGLSGEFAEGVSPEAYNYSVDTQNIVIAVKPGTTIDQYFSLTSMDERTIDLTMRIECFPGDNSCTWFKFLTRRSKLGEEYNEVSTIKSIYLTPKHEGSVLFHIDVPASASLNTYYNTIVLEDSQKETKRIIIKIKVVDMIQTQPYISMLKKEIPYFTIRESRLFGEYHVKYGDIVYLLGGIILIGLLYRIGDIIFNPKRKRMK